MWYESGVFENTLEKMSNVDHLEKNNAMKVSEI